MRFGGLFSGFGGWELGLERAGHEIAWLCESDWYARRVLERHFPGRPIYPDVRDVRAGEVEPVQGLCGGFPCQDISGAGRQAGIDRGERSGLWREFLRLIRELRPELALVENVPGRPAREWLGRVLGDLAEIRYDAEWESLRASDFDAPHLRERVWIAAYPERVQLRVEPITVGRGQRATKPADDGAAQPLAVPARGGRANGNRGAGDSSTEERLTGSEPTFSDRRVFPDTDGGAVLTRWLGGRVGGAGGPGWWAAEPDVGRVADGVPSRMERLTGLGNALVPVIAEWIGSRIE